MAADSQHEPSDAVEVTIRIEQAQAGRFDEIVTTLKQVGLTEALPHPRFCIVNGTVRADCLPDLRQVDGVASVREDRVYRPRTG